MSYFLELFKSFFTPISEVVNFDTLHICQPLPYQTIYEQSLKENLLLGLP